MFSRSHPTITFILVPSIFSLIFLVQTKRGRRVRIIGYYNLLRLCKHLDDMLVPFWSIVYVRVCVSVYIIVPFSSFILHVSVFSMIAFRCTRTMKTNNNRIADEFFSCSIQVFLVVLNRPVILLFLYFQFGF